jgi:cobalt-precorrin 5A hydrolase/precorrin-3B C17-methyltransferase
VESLGRPVIVLLSESGRETAERLAGRIPGAEIHGLAGRISEAEADLLFEHTAAHLQSLFLAGREILGICATAILIRSLGPVISDKRTEAPVVSLSGDGRVAVPLLGGHHGANARAQEIAGIFGGSAAITTAGDVRFGVSLEEPPEGYVLANPEGVKEFTARLLAGEKVRLDGELGWLRASSLPQDSGGALVIGEGVEKSSNDPGALSFLARKVVVGVGCERNCDPGEVIGLVRRTLEKSGIDPRAVGLVVSLDLKADEAAVHLLAKNLGCPLRFFSPAFL